MSEREMIEQACAREGLKIQAWDPEHENGLTAKLGRYTVVTPDYEDDGLYEGDDGELSACVVGAEKFGNQRVSFGFMPDGTDGPNDVNDLAALDPTDD